MPQSEHAQPVEGERKEGDESNRAKEQRQARDKSRPEDGRDYWRAGQQEDESAGDEGIDDLRSDDDLDDTLDDALEARTEDDEREGTAQLDAGPRGFDDDVVGDDVDVPNNAKRNDINDKTR